MLLIKYYNFTTIQKTIGLITLFVLIQFPKAFSQSATTSYFQYSYDLAGNRTSREFFVLSPRPLDSLPDSIIRQYGLSGYIKSPDQTSNTANQTSTITSPGNSNIIEEGLSTIRIYPNPVKTGLEIVGKLPDVEGAVTLSLHTMDGKQIRKQENFTLPGAINLADLADGSYILRLSHNNKSKDWQILKIK